MRYLSGNRCATILLSAAYLLANVAGGLLHDHAHQPAVAACGHAHAHCSTTHHDGADDEHESHGVAGFSSPASEGQPPHDDDCTVCRATCQRVLSVEPGQLDPLGDLSVELTIVFADQPLSAFARTIRSRAPPVVG